ncbi:hypothetical protein [Streptomyces sp. NPDC046860]|uniref:hypothetical protein n=1 Tax=Streptomyces sp. NPDC046860 TaxID=3154495 RepID=UPI0033DCFC1F
MFTSRRRLRFTAVSAMAVLALTGFSSGRGHGSGSSHGGGGGGCSNSHQDHDSSSSSSVDDTSGDDPFDIAPEDVDPYGDSSGGSGSYRYRPGVRSTPTTSSGGKAQALADGSAVLIHCVTALKPYTTVEVSNPNRSEGVFSVEVTFHDERGLVLHDVSEQVKVPAEDTATLRIPAARSWDLEQIDHCEVDPWATADH